MCIAGFLMDNNQTATEANASFTVGKASLMLGATVIHQGFNYATHISPVLLAEPYRGHPTGTQIGWTQTRTGYRRHEPALTSGLRGYCVQGITYDWLVREFDEHNCGDFQARKDSIQPGAVFTATRIFGYLGKDHPCYVPGDSVRVDSLEGSQVLTTVTRQTPPQGTRPGVFLLHLKWDLEALQSLVSDYALRLTDT